MILGYTADTPIAARQSALTSNPNSTGLDKSTSTYTILAVATIVVVFASVFVKLRLSRAHQAS